LTVAVVPQKPDVTSTPVGDVTDQDSFTLTCTTGSTLSSPSYIWTVNSVAQAAQSAATLTQTADISNVVSYKCEVSDNGADYSNPSDFFVPSGTCTTVLVQFLLPISIIRLIL
jgi:hypothetical protein